MKSTSIFCLFISFFVVSCSSKISNEQISKLESRQAILQYNTKINQDRLELEKEQVRQTRIKEKLQDASDDAKSASNKAHDVAKRINRNPQDANLARKAEKASRKSANRAEDVNDLNHDLQKSINKIKDLQKDIDETKVELQKMQSKIQYVPNTNQH
jgi:peptidoglycan hydrolase CwlO-like protein